MRAKFLVPKNNPTTFSIEFADVPQDKREQIVNDLQKVIELRDKLGNKRIEQIHTFLIKESPDFLDKILPTLTNADGSPNKGLLSMFGL